MYTYVFKLSFFWKKCNFMHFERRKYILPFKMHQNYIVFTRKPEKILGFTSKFRLGWITLNTGI